MSFSSLSELFTVIRSPVTNVQTASYAEIVYRASAIYHTIHAKPLLRSPSIGNDDDHVWAACIEAALGAVQLNECMVSTDYVGTIIDRVLDVFSLPSFKPDMDKKWILSMLTPSATREVMARNNSRWYTNALTSTADPLSRYLGALNTRVLSNLTNTSQKSLSSKGVQRLQITQCRQQLLDKRIVWTSESLRKLLAPIHLILWEAAPRTFPVNMKLLESVIDAEPNAFLSMMIGFKETSKPPPITYRVLGLPSPYTSSDVAEIRSVGTKIIQAYSFEDAVTLLQMLSFESFGNTIHTAILRKPIIECKKWIHYFHINIRDDSYLKRPDYYSIIGAIPLDSYRLLSDENPLCSRYESDLQFQKTYMTAEMIAYLMNIENNKKPQYMSLFRFLLESCDRPLLDAFQNAFTVEHCSYFNASEYDLSYHPDLETWLDAFEAHIKQLDPNFEKREKLPIQFSRVTSILDALKRKDTQLVTRLLELQNPRLHFNVDAAYAQDIWKALNIEMPSELQYRVYCTLVKPYIPQNMAAYNGFIRRMGLMYIQPETLNQFFHDAETSVLLGGNLWFLDDLGGYTLPECTYFAKHFAKTQIERWIEEKTPETIERFYYYLDPTVLDTWIYEWETLSAPAIFSIHQFVTSTRFRTRQEIHAHLQWVLHHNIPIQDEDYEVVRLLGAACQERVEWILEFLLPKLPSNASLASYVPVLARWNRRNTYMLFKRLQTEHPLLNFQIPETVFEAKPDEFDVSAYELFLRENYTDEASTEVCNSYLRSSVQKQPRNIEELIVLLILYGYPKPDFCAFIEYCAMRYRDNRWVQLLHVHGVEVWTKMVGESGVQAAKQKRAREE
jgi:hypothetical protein